jgi:hypothetical protein
MIPVRVIIRPPGVVPGLADIDVRVLTNDVKRVTVLPVHWRAGVRGAPPPDVCQPVEGDTNLFHAQLWLMARGAYSVHVAVETAAGSGKVIVPVNSLATTRLPMSPILGDILIGLGLLLFVLAISVVGAAVRESVLAPGLKPSRRQQWRGRGAVGLAALVLGLAIVAGRTWWNNIDLQHRNNHLYKPVPASAEVRVQDGQRIARLEVHPRESGSVGWTPLVPDHGKLMHLFLVREPGMDVLAHLHPVRRSPNLFETVLPPVPVGSYRLYADVTHENGFSQTLTAGLSIPDPPEGASTESALSGDPDDSWHEGKPLAEIPGKARCALEDGSTMSWENGGGRSSLIAGRETLLRFLVKNDDGEPVKLDPYMGMLSHAILRREDGGVFAHLHPAGSISVAAQQVFQLRAGEPRSKHITPEMMEKLCQLPDGQWPQQPIVFPYEFPAPGRFRIWVQVKVSGRVQTGVFDADVRPAR